MHTSRVYICIYRAAQGMLITTRDAWHGMAWHGMAYALPPPTRISHPCVQSLISHTSSSLRRVEQSRVRVRARARRPTIIVQLPPLPPLLFLLPPSSFLRGDSSRSGAQFPERARARHARHECGVHMHMHVPTRRHMYAQCK